jgi:hypothetical protein
MRSIRAITKGLLVLLFFFLAILPTILPVMNISVSTLIEFICDIIKLPVIVLAFYVFNRYWERIFSWVTGDAPIRKARDRTKTNRLKRIWLWLKFGIFSRSRNAEFKKQKARFMEQEEALDRKWFTDDEAY